MAAIAVLADVTEQKQSARALVESEVWFRSLVQNSTDMVMVLGPDGTFDYMSPSAAEFVGFEADDVAKRRVNEILSPDPDDLTSLQETFVRLRAEPGSVEMTTFRLKRADGAMRWIEMAASNLIDDSAVRGIVINARDITETFEADAAVRASEERLSVLVSSVSDAISVVGADGTLLYSSPVADAMFGDLGGDGGNGLRFPRAGRSTRGGCAVRAGARRARPVPSRRGAHPPRRWLDPRGRGDREQPARRAGGTRHRDDDSRHHRAQARRARAARERRASA